ncbi:IS3 family transposase, partial [Lentilactobacillus sp. Marseille-Q4993]|uniref:IS3 family transposase n=1 Tax=Lentilactobacillus sp. Marseille-Q4993 TaxID=3039492 RepID=UPI0032DF2660
MKKTEGDRKKGRQEEKYRTVQALTKKIDERTGKKFTTAYCCQSIGIARSSYYDWLTHKPSKRDLEDQAILDYIIPLEEANNYIFGVESLVMYLNKETDYHASASKMRRIMHQYNIKASIKTKKHNHQARRESIISENLLLSDDLTHDFQPERPDKYWTTDCTELTYGIRSEHKLRLSVIKDLYDHSIVAWEIGDTETSELVTNTFELAVKNNGGVYPDLLHSDRGSGYTSGLFNTTLAKVGVLHSMSRPGTPGDNSPIESFWSHIKEEYFQFHNRITKNEMNSEIEECINWYNFNRRQ